MSSVRFASVFLFGSGLSRLGFTAVRDMKDTLESPSTSPTPDWRDKVTWYTHETSAVRLVKIAGNVLFRLLAEVECVGQENVPKTGGCIVAANHVNDFDILYMGICNPRHPHFMAKAELYKNPVFGWLIRLGGSFPVYRGKKDQWALQQAGRILTAGETLFMFPEGTRSRNGQLREGKVGVIKLALEHQMPVIPAAILGTQNIHFSLWNRAKVKIEFGQPLDIGSLAGPPPHSYETMAELTTTLMQKIAAMLPPEQRGVYGV